MHWMKACETRHVKRGNGAGNRTNKKRPILDGRMVGSANGTRANDQQGLGNRKLTGRSGRPEMMARGTSERK